MINVEEQVEKLWTMTKECMVEFLGGSKYLVDVKVDDFKKTYEGHPERLMGFQVLMDERKYRNGLFGFIQPMLIAEHIFGESLNIRTNLEAYQKIARKNSWPY
jgi:hypothetical protein